MYPEDFLEQLNLKYPITRDGEDFDIKKRVAAKWGYDRGWNSLDKQIKNYKFDLACEREAKTFYKNLCILLCLLFVNMILWFRG